MFSLLAQQSGDEPAPMLHTRELDGIELNPRASPRASAKPDDATEAALAAQLSRVAQGDQRAFERFYDATLSRVFAVARRFCSDSALAEEVVEDVYLQAWQHAARYDAARGPVLAWLLMMARSRALDALRRRDEAQVTDDPHALLAAEDAVETEDDDPLDVLHALRRDSATRSALSTLPARERQLLGLAFLRGMTHAEIAEFAQLPLGSVKTSIRRALQTLRALLSNYAPTQSDLTQSNSWVES